MKEFPAVAYRLGFLQNSTHTEYRVLKDHLTEPQENIQRYDSREEMKKMNNGDREFEPVAAVLDGGEWGWEREREGGVVGMDEREEVDEYQLEDILREVLTLHVLHIFPDFICISWIEIISFFLPTTYILC